MQKANATAADIAAIGVTNQRETVVLWERATGKPVANAIVWQSRISTPICEQLKQNGLEPLFREKTGLVVDPYFSGTKIKHLLDHDEQLRTRGEKGEVLFGTVDSFLLWRPTGGRVHATDVSNASRTLLFNIHTRDWDDELLGILGVPRKMLPEIKPSSGILGESDAEHFGGPIRIAGIAGDQQAATFGQVCFEKGMAKNTYGTGCFLVMNTGDAPVQSKNNLLTTIGWQIGDEVTYCLEGSIFVAGAVVQWLRDGLGIISRSEEIEALADSVPDSDGVYFVPALTGLGAPHWDPFARGTILGITRSTKAAHIARAAVESMAFQSTELVQAMAKDAALAVEVLRVEGGPSVNDSLMQFQADLLNTPVHRPTISETTALGAAYLAGLAVGFWESQAELANKWSLEKEFLPTMDEVERSLRLKRWHNAVQRSLHWENH